MKGKPKNNALSGTFSEAKPVANADAVWKGKPKNAAVNGTL